MKITAQLAFNEINQIYSIEFDRIIFVLKTNLTKIEQFFRVLF